MEIERIRGRGVWPDNMARCTALYSTVLYKQDTEAVSEGFFIELIQVCHSTRINRTFTNFKFSTFKTITMVL